MSQFKKFLAQFDEIDARYQEVVGCAVPQDDAQQLHLLGRTRAIVTELETLTEVGLTTVR